MDTARVMNAVRAIDRDIAICYTPGWFERNEEASMRRCAELGCSWVQPVRDTLTAEALAFARGLGLRGNCFYADCETDYAHLCNLGAPGIMTNAPARLAAWLRRTKVGN